MYTFLNIQYSIIYACIRSSSLVVRSSGRVTVVFIAAWRNSDLAHPITLQKVGPAKCHRC